MILTDEGKKIILAGRLVNGLLLCYAQVEMINIKKKRATIVLRFLDEDGKVIGEFPGTFTLSKGEILKLAKIYVPISIE